MVEANGAVTVVKVGAPHYFRFGAPHLCQFSSQFAFREVRRRFYKAIFRKLYANEDYAKLLGVCPFNLENIVTVTFHSQQSYHVY